MREIDWETKKSGTLNWLKDNGQPTDFAGKDISTVMAEAGESVTAIMNSRHIEGGNGSQHKTENKIIRDDVKRYFGFTDEDIQSFGKVGGGSWYMNITAEIRSIVVNTACGIAMGH